MELSSNNTTELPVGGQDNTSEFKTIIDQSRAKIESEAIDKSKAKRGRGRPRKTDLSGTGNDRSQNSQTANEVQSPHGTSSTAAPNITQHLIAPIIVISKAPAIKYQIPELAFTPDEAHLCAMSLNECLQAFAPSLQQMDPKTAAVLGVCMTFGSIGFSKYQIYLSRKMVIQKTEKTAQEKVNEEQKRAPIDAGDYFAKNVA